MTQTINVTYDARLSLGKYRGMGRFLRQLIAGHEQQFLGLCARNESDPTLRLHAEGSSFYPYWEQVNVPRVLRSLRPDLYLAPYNTAPLRIPGSTRLLLVVHDLIYLENLPASRSLYQNLGRQYRRLVVPRAIRRADHIITGAEYAANEIRERFDLHDKKITVISSTLDESWYQPQDTQRVPENFVLMVSGEAPSKNLNRALEAFALFRHGRATERRTAPVLKIGGVSPGVHAHFAGVAGKLGIGDAVEFLPYLSMAELQALYREASLVMVPSLAEGFGIPLLEGMASGVPCIASSTTSLPEVGGDAALYFDPYSPPDMARAMEQALSAPALRQTMIQRGLLQAMRYHPSTFKRLSRELWTEMGVEPADEGKNADRTS